MDIQKIHTDFVTRHTPLMIAFGAFFALRLPWLGRGNLWEFLASAVIQVLIALFILYLTQLYRIIRYQTLLPAFFYVLLVGTNPLFFYDLRGSISALLFVSCLAFLFQSYHNPLSQWNILSISSILTLGSFYWAPLLLTFPLFWQGMYRFQVLNRKNCMACLTGIAMIFLFLFAWSVYKNDLTIFERTLSGWSAAYDFRFGFPSIRGWVKIAFLIFLLTLSGIRIFTAGVSEKMQTTNILYFLFMLTGILFFALLLQSQWTPEWLLILYIPISLLVAHYFTHSSKENELRLFLLTIFFFLGTFAWEWIVL
jgi:hypothetical protein